ncbi:MAG: hypothetical protein ACHBN1_07670 [Heteroscytonema crispum UTEX LB 1556]
MATKTDRILSYLPGTFQVLPKAVVLYAVADAFGKELLQAENSLAEVMSAHWVDFADRNADTIKDLKLIAALYGLAPRTDDDGNFTEGVEEFRRHLKRYIRTFLEGTVTVQGILRVTAESLGLQIADDYKDLDSWWNRQQQELITLEPRGDDATSLFFGIKTAQAVGKSARSALVKGNVLLDAGINLEGANNLRLKINNNNAITIDLLEDITHTTSVNLEQIVKKINTRLNASVARFDKEYLILASPNPGSSSILEVQDVINDAAERLLGLAPRVYRGSNATAAQITGKVDLSGVVNLQDERYLRLLIDDRYLAEIDLTGGSSAARTLDQIRDTINNALTVNVASHNNRFLTLTSPTTGAGSSIVFQKPAAQDATIRLFGAVPSFESGKETQAAQIIGKSELTRGVDLSNVSFLKIRIDAQSAVTINCVGANPANTQPVEIVTAINSAFGREIATYNGKFLTLTSPTRGANSQVVLETHPTSDATEKILGIRPRIYQGTNATTARIVSIPISQGVDLRAAHRIQIAVDGKAPVEIDLRSHAQNVGAVTLIELQAAINNLLPNVALHDGTNLIIASSLNGSASSIAIGMSERVHRRPFVTRATIIDEATQAIFGFMSRQATGTAATAAKVFGKVDVSRGVNLQQKRFLRISVDGQPPQEIDFAANSFIPRPRAATTPEIIAAINQKFGVDIASDNGGEIIFTSPSSRANSKITFLPSQGDDARLSLLGVEPGIFRGQDATKITFTGTVNLSNGINLPAQAKIKLAIDGGTLTEIIIGDDTPRSKTLSEIVAKINQILSKTVASQNGKYLILTSSLQGEASRIEFALPSAPDATQAIFGITAPRSYRGKNGAPAQVIGVKDLSQGADLRVARIFKLSVEGKPGVEINCAGQRTDPANLSLPLIVEEINNAIDKAAIPAIATHDNIHLILSSVATGTSARLELLPYTAADAREKLLENVPEETKGSDALPAIITGEIDLLKPINLGERSLIKLSVNSDRPIDIDVSGSFPEKTFLDEIIAKINAVIPGLASATENDRLQLTSPTAGEDSQLSLIPLRFLEIIEYPPEKVQKKALIVKHRDRIPIVNNGKDIKATAEIEIIAPDGTVGPSLVNEDIGWQIRLFVVLSVGDRVRLWRDSQLGLQVKITTPTGESRLLSGAEMLVGPIGNQKWVPFAEPVQMLQVTSESYATLQLNNPLAPNIVLLRAAQRPGIIGNQISVNIREATIPATGNTLERLVGQIRLEGGEYRLLGQNQTVIAQMRSGGNVNFAAYTDRVVAVRGTLHDGEPLLMIVENITNLFDVTVRFQPAEGKAIEENYNAVTIGVGITADDSLVRVINAGSRVLQSSQLVKAEELDKATILSIPTGESDWVYLDCYGSRFNRADFNSSYFAGGFCIESGVFNISRFPVVPKELFAAVFSGSDKETDPGVQIIFDWENHRPGAFIVNLPADLPSRFGGKFNEARFSQGKDQPEQYLQAVTEPASDENSLVKIINEGNTKHELPRSNFVTAQQVPVVPLGWQPVKMPFRKPQFLTLGRDIPSAGNDGFARLYIAEEGFDNFIEIKAKEIGNWGNKIAVSSRKSGAAKYDVTIIYNDSYFENAIAVVSGGKELPVLTDKILEPGAIGVLQAKAAGIQATVTRDGCSGQS